MEEANASESQNRRLVVVFKDESAGFLHARGWVTVACLKRPRIAGLQHCSNRIRCGISAGIRDWAMTGKQGEDRAQLDWETRFRIALGVARGVAHIHLQQGGKLVHGNIKSSNVFLNNHNYGCVSDLGLATIVNLTIPPWSRIAGYHAPEVVDTRKASQASDVYSFGVLVLELLTGKSPIQKTGGSDDVIHLVRWVNSVVREEWTAEVFDLQLMRYSNIEEEMVELLRIAMACVARMPEQRPKMLDVVRMIEDAKKLDIGSRASAEERLED